MFTGRVARQTNRLYVRRMTVKLAYWKEQVGVAKHRPAGGGGVEGMGNDKF